MNSIRSRLIVTLATSLAVILAGGGAGVYFLTRSALRKDFDATLHSAFAEIERTTWGPIIEKPLEFHVFKTAGKPGPTLYFEVWTEDQKLLGRSDSLEGRDLAMAPATQPKPQNLSLPGGRPGRGLAARTVIPKEFGSSEGWLKEYMEAGLRERVVKEENEARERKSRQIPKALIIAVAGDSSEMEAAVRRLAWVLWTFGLMVLGVAIAVVALVSRRGLAPLQQVAEQAGCIDASSLDFRFTTRDLPSELQTICQRLNDLLVRLDAAFARERRFTADVAHELRTPITELRSLAEVTLAYPGPDAAMTNAFQDALDIALQMQGVVNGLLAIARCEAGTQIMVCETVDLAALGRKIWKRFEAQAACRRLRIDLDLNQPMRIQTDPGMLGMILSNLMSNTVEHAPPEGFVQICLAGDGADFSFTVTNAVENLIPEDMDHIFERFWRKDTVRSSGEHSGIGLSIAQAYARALGLTLSASLGIDGLLTMQLAGKLGSDISIEERATGRTFKTVAGPGLKQVAPLS